MSLKTNTVSSGYSTGVINSNFKKIEDYVNDNLLNRDGVTPGEPNQMEVDLDMNSQDILNIGEMGAKEIILDGTSLKELLGNSPSPGSGGIESIVAGSGISVDDSDPVNPIVSATGGGGSIDSIVAGNGISVDDSDPANPVISTTGSAGAEVNVQIGTAYTLVLTDAFKMVTMDNSDANTITVPPNSAVAFPDNTRIDLGQDGAGQTTVVAGAGVTIRTPETLKLRKQWSKASLIRRATDVWDIVGDMEAAP